jgi:hydrogenase nickel incorporation protein HypA/HybF
MKKQIYWSDAEARRQGVGFGLATGGTGTGERRRGIETTLTPVAMREGIVHELSVCQALLAQVAKIAAAHGATSVARVTVEVGPLSGIEPVLLANAFAAASTGSYAAGAALSIETSVVMISCLACGVESQARPNRLLCAACGGYRTRVVGGDELRLRRVELQVQKSPLVQTA